MPPFPRGEPRIVVEGGITARTQRGGTFGATPWGRRFVAAFEALEDRGRLERGRSYARTGQVLSLAVGPGRIEAEVQGSREQPYRVTLVIGVLSDLAWARVAARLAGRAAFRAALVSGELPADLESVFIAAGAPLYPARSEELVPRCTCPDDARLCKHAAAVLYLVAEAFDDDPFLLLAWRGRTRDELLIEIDLHAGADARRMNPDAAGPDGGARLTARSFWIGDPAALDLPVEHPGDTPADAIIAGLPPRPGALTRDDVTALRERYRVIVEDARARLGGEG